MSQGHPVTAANLRRFVKLRQAGLTIVAAAGCLRVSSATGVTLDRLCRARRLLPPPGRKPATNSADQRRLDSCLKHRGLTAGRFGAW